MKYIVNNLKLKRIIREAFDDAADGAPPPGTAYNYAKWNGNVAVFPDGSEFNIDEYLMELYEAGVLSDDDFEYREPGTPEHAEARKMFRSLFKKHGVKRVVDIESGESISASRFI